MKQETGPLKAAPLTTERLRVRYGRTIAVRDVSLTVGAGSIYALLGRNGAGKSSLLRCALGLQKPNRGTARVFGRDTWRKRLVCSRRSAFVPERPDAPPRLTAPQIVRFCAALDERLDREAAFARLKRFEIPPQTAFGSLSRGQQAQVQLTLALGVRPELLVLDDPTLGLDAVARKAFYDELIDELAERAVTVLLTTHDLDAAERIADRVGVLVGGELIIDEPLEALKGRYRKVIARTPTEQAELAELTVAAHREESWGHEAIVSNYSDTGRDDGLDRSFRGSTALTLEEIFRSLDLGEDE